MEGLAIMREFLVRWIREFREGSIWTCIAVFQLSVLMIPIGMIFGCARTPPLRPVAVKTPIVEVAVPALCPASAERDRLRTLRPPRLAGTPIPETRLERVARIVAQLGFYEAPGGFADQVDAALDRCQRQ